MIEKDRDDELIRTAFEHGPAGMLAVDEGGRVVTANREAERVFGWGKGELAGQAVESLVPERYRAGHTGYRAAFHADPHGRPMGTGRELVGLRRDGTEFPVEIGLQRVTTGRGVLVLVSVVDLTTRRRADVERRIAHEIDIAREVQGRLLPQRVPSLESLELAARCIQARSVGGDYYDFLDLGPRHVGLVLADVSGKGVHAALRMANLQAHLRSQAASAPQDPLRALRHVNRMLVESTEPGHFATLFLGVYADATRRLTYINCGHNPPLCLRAGGAVEPLPATATVIGAFEDWECGLGRMQLAPGDLLVAYSDGVTEAADGTEEFGEARLLETLRAHSGRPPEEILGAILTRVRGFGDGSQTDDLTVMVGRIR